MTLYTSISSDGMKMKTSTRETDYTVGFLVGNHVKMTINMSHSNTGASGPQGNLLSIDKNYSFKVPLAWSLRVLLVGTRSTICRLVEWQVRA